MERNSRKFCFTVIVWIEFSYIPICISVDTNGGLCIGGLPSYLRSSKVLSDEVDNSKINSVIMLFRDFRL